MQEHSLLIDQALKNGLRPDVRVGRHTEALVEMRNLKPTPHGAVSPEILTYPITDPAFSQDWPYPQLRKTDSSDGRQGLFFYDGSQFGTVNETNWVVLIFSLWEAGNDTQSATLAAGGGTVSLAVFSESYFLTDGANLIFDTSGNPSSKVLVTDDSVFKCNSVHRADDRLFIAGISGSFLTDTRWTSLFDLWRDTSDPGTYTATNEDMDTHYVLWSEEGGGDVDHPFETLKGILDISLSTTAADNNIETMLREAIEKRTIGIIPCQNTGEIQAITTVDGRMVVYGKRGISVLSKKQFSSKGTDIVIGYDESPLSLMRGIPGRGCVAGDESENVMVDTEGDLWRISADGPQRLGYSEFIEPLTLADIVVSFDPQERDYWISDGVSTYILTPNGLGGKTSLLPSSLIRSHGSSDLIGTAPTVDFDVTVTPPTDLDPDDPDIVLIRTVQVDFGRRGQKHITSMQTASDGIRDGRATAHYRYDQTSSTFTRRKQDKITPDGFSRHDINLIDGEIEVLGVAPTQEAVYDWVNVRYQTDDRRHIRGTTGRPPGS